MSSTVGPQPGPLVERVAGPEQDPGERRRAGLQRTVRDMVLSMLVILAFAAAWWALVPTPNGVPIQNVDVAGAAQQVSSRLSFAPAVPQGLPPGWVATSAEVDDSGNGLLTWHIGYVTADGHNASIEQIGTTTTDARLAWENIMDSGGDLRSPVVVDGTTWEQRYKDVRFVTALIHRGEERTTIVTSRSGGLDNAETLARSIPASQR